MGAIRTSDLARATETAAILAEVLGAEVSTDERLREQHLGHLQGRTYAETWTAAERHDWSNLDLAVAGGESPRTVRERMAAVVDGIDRSVVTVLVSHGDAIRSAVAHLAIAPFDDALWVEVPNGAVARVMAGDLAWLT